MDFDLAKLKEEYSFDIHITHCARGLVRYRSSVETTLSSKNRMELAYVLCMNETKKWFGLGSYIGLSDIPEEQRFKVLRDVVSAMVMDGLIDNIENSVNQRRLRVSCALADKLNTIYNRTLEGTK